MSTKSPTASPSARLSPEQPMRLLGGLTPTQFMSQHWQKKPMVVRAAFDADEVAMGPQALMAVVGNAAVEARVVSVDDGQWQVDTGPFGPPLASGTAADGLALTPLPGLQGAAWTLMVQGVDGHLDCAAALRRQFRFLSDAMLDDVMAAWSPDGAGLGPQGEADDVFHLQVSGRRRWHVGRLLNEDCLPDAPIRVLSEFEADDTLETGPGDLLYLPPGHAHDSVSMSDDCIWWTLPARGCDQAQAAREVLQRTLDAVDDDDPDTAGDRFHDPKAKATQTPGLVPASLQAFVQQAVKRLAGDPQALHCALGEWLTEHHPVADFGDEQALVPGMAIALHPRTKMLYDKHHVFINGDAYQASGEDARVMRLLADDRHLSAPEVQRLGAEAWALLEDWAGAGWVRSIS